MGIDVRHMKISQSHHPSIYLEKGLYVNKGAISKFRSGLNSIG